MDTNALLHDLAQLRHHLDQMAEAIGTEVMRTPILPQFDDRHGPDRRRHLSYDAAAIAALSTLTLAVGAIALEVQSLAEDMRARTDMLATDVATIGGRL